jgi:hypothetical protein
MVPTGGKGPEDGMGDDEELTIGGKVAGMRQGPVVEKIVNQEESNTYTQNVITVNPSMQMVMDPNLANYGQYVPVPGYQTIQTTW